MGEHFARWQLPDDVVYLDTLPMTATGKVSKLDAAPAVRRPPAAGGRGGLVEEVSFAIAGRPFHARAWGEPGRPLILLLHGFPEFSGAWEEVAPRLADGWFCVAPDQRGYGRSWRPEGVERYAMRELVSDAEAVVERFGAGRAAAVVGHDWGASVAYALAIRAPRADGAPGRAQRRPPDRLPGGAGGRRAAGGAEPVHPLAAARGLGAADRRADGHARLWRMFGDLPGALGPGRRAAYEAAWGGAAGLRSMVDWYRASPIRVPEPGAPIPPNALPAWDRERFRIAMPHLVIWGLEDAAFVPELRLGAQPYADRFGAGGDRRSRPLGRPSRARAGRGAAPAVPRPCLRGGAGGRAGPIEGNVRPGCRVRHRERSGERSGERTMPFRILVLTLAFGATVAGCGDSTLERGLTGGAVGAGVGEVVADDPGTGAVIGGRRRRPDGLSPARGAGAGSLASVGQTCLRPPAAPPRMGHRA